MSTQTTISQYFSNRKRRGVDEIKSVNQDKKVLILDQLNPTDLPSKECDGGERLILKRKISWDSDYEVPKKKVVTPVHHNPKRTPKFTTIRSSLKSSRIKSVEKSIARKSLFSDNTAAKKSCQTSLNFDLDSKPVESPTDPTPLSSSDPEDSPAVEDSSPPVINSVPEVKASANDSTSNVTESAKPLTTNPELDQVVPGSSADEKLAPVNVKPETIVPNEPKPSTSAKTSLREELGLGDIRKKLKGSSRLDKIRDAIKRIDKGYDKLAEIQARKDKAPSLSQFDSIEIEVPCSPVKNRFKIEPYKPSLPSPSKLREAVFKSPAKVPPPPGSKLPYVSPRKLLDEMRPRDTSSLTKSPIYERYCSLAAQAGKPCLPLPYSYRILGEMFRSVEIVVSMMYNRKETVHFSKLKRSTQELTKKNLSEHHLGQMLKVFPNAFRLTYDKVKILGKPDRSELTVTPILPTNEGDYNAEQMIPSSTLERQRFFYKQLLNIAKAHHEKYLLSLDPPLIVDKDKLTRWHPGFDLDSCPDIEPADIPKPPTLENVTSAKQFLGKAKEMFVVNPRMEKALEKLSQSENTINSNGKPSAASAVPTWANALKGLPKSLLEKVRAKQAAKAVEMLTRDPQKMKQDIEVSRLPEMARILRNLYVAERKNVMLKPHILDKLESSFRENLSASEMDHHLMLLVEKTKPWLKINKDGHVTYISMDKSMEMNSVYKAINAPS